MSNVCPDAPDMEDCKSKKKRCLTGPCIGQSYTEGEECGPGYAFSPDTCECVPIGIRLDVLAVRTTLWSYYNLSFDCTPPSSPVYCAKGADRNTTLTNVTYLGIEAANPVAYDVIQSGCDCTSTAATTPFFTLTYVDHGDNDTIKQSTFATERSTGTICQGTAGQTWTSGIRGGWLESIKGSIGGEQIVIVDNGVWPESCD